MNYSAIIIIALLAIIVIYLLFSASKKTVSSTAKLANIEEGESSELQCVRCFNTRMVYNGVERFHVGSNSAPFFFW